MLEKKNQQRLFPESEEIWLTSTETMHTPRLIEHVGSFLSYGYWWLLPCTVYFIQEGLIPLHSAELWLGCMQY